MPLTPSGPAGPAGPGPEPDLSMLAGLGGPAPSPLPGLGASTPPSPSMLRATPVPGDEIGELRARLESLEERIAVLEQTI